MFGMNILASGHTLQERRQNHGSVCKIAGENGTVDRITLALALLVGGVALLLWPEKVLHLLLRAAAVLAITAGICLLVPLRR